MGQRKMVEMDREREREKMDRKAVEKAKLDRYSQGYGMFGGSSLDVFWRPGASEGRGVEEN